MAFASVLAAGCGEDKNYGDPIEDPNAQFSATSAITNAMQLTSEATNDAALVALNGISANFNLLGGAKLQHEQMTARLLPGESGVDEACVDIDESGITYNDCDFAGNTVNGAVRRSGSNTSVDLVFAQVSEDTAIDIDIDGSVDVTETAIDGFIDFEVRIESDDFSVTTSLDGDYDVQLADGCAVGGQLEVHAYASAAGQSQSVWAKAEYGPACGDVTIF